MLFLSSECVCAVHGTFTSEYVYAVLCYFSRANVFTLFMVLSRANMFTLFYVIFLERMCLRCLWYFHERMCLRCFMLLFLERMCLRCFWYLHERICFRCLCYFFFFFFSSECVFAVYYTFTSEYVCAVLCYFPRANVFALFHDTFTSGCVYAVYGHVDYKRHEAVLKQCRPLTHDPRLPAVVTQLLGDDENKKIAGQIQKILKSDHLFSAPQVHRSPFPAPAGVPGYLRQQGSGRGRYTPYGYGSYNNYASRGFNTTRCYNCRKTGHRIANCPALKRA